MFGKVTRRRNLRAQEIGIAVSGRKSPCRRERAAPELDAAADGAGQLEKRSRAGEDGTRLLALAPDDPVRCLLASASTAARTRLPMTASSSEPAAASFSCTPRILSIAASNALPPSRAILRPIRSFA